MSGRVLRVFICIMSWGFIFPNAIVEGTTDDRPKP
jgi:hypothetical protein